MVAPLPSLLTFPFDFGRVRDEVVVAFCMLLYEVTFGLYGEGAVWLDNKVTTRVNDIPIAAEMLTIFRLDFLIKLYARVAWQNYNQLINLGK